MARKRKSAAARRRERLRQQQKRQRQRKRLLTAVLVVLVASIAGYAAWQALGREEDVNLAAVSEPEGTLMETERPLADVEPAARDGHYDAYPEMIIDPEKAYEAVIETEKGEIRVRLFAEEAPLTVNNFVYLANQGFYDGVTFHRVIDDFMAQGGDPTGRGSGGPGYTFEDETGNGLTFSEPGLLAMANAGANTNGSQFFITFAPAPWLDGNHTIYGEVIEGEQTLSQLTRRQPGAATPGDVIERILIYESDESSNG